MPTTPFTPDLAQIKSAVDQTLGLISAEENEASNLSADWVMDEDGKPVLSVINLDAREHWHLIVRVLPPVIRK